MNKHLNQSSAGQLRIVADSAVFLEGARSPEDLQLILTPGVDREVAKGFPLRMLERLRAAGKVEVRAPGPAALARVDEMARETGDAPVLSPTDREVIALALELELELWTDDFSVRNVGERLGVLVVPVTQDHYGGARDWEWLCSACGKAAEGAGECPVCGARIKRQERSE